MKTTKQAEANRRNAQKSTGPRTEEGKRASRLNALKHGLTAQQAVIPGEDPAEYEGLLDRLTAEFDPQSIVQETLVELIASVLWRLKRISTFEPAIIVASLSLSDQADAVFMRKVNEMLTSGAHQAMMNLLEDMREKGELSGAERAILDSIAAHGVAVEDFNAPASRLGRALVVQGNALDGLGRLSRYERDLIANLQRYLDQIESEKKKHARVIEADGKEIEWVG